MRTYEVKYRCAKGGLGTMTIQASSFQNLKQIFENTAAPGSKILSTRAVG